MNRDRVMAAHAVVRQTLEAMELSSAERADASLLAFVTFATHERSAATHVGGFVLAQARQIVDLEQLAARIQAEIPDLELERLRLEGDADALRRYVVAKALKDRTP
jgi:hypothetical protein